MSEETESEEIGQVDEIAALLSEAAETHHLVYRLTDGEDPDWASWYAKWLLDLSEFPDMTGDEIVPSHLVYELVRLDRDYTETQPDEAWEMYYAQRLLDEFGEIDLEGDDESDEDADADENPFVTTDTD